MRPRRLLVVSEPMEYGVLSYLEHLLDGLDRASWEPALAYSPHRMAPQAHALVTRLARQGVRLARLPFRRRAGTGDLGAARALFAELRAFRPDLVHLHSTKAGVLGRPLARLLGIPALYTSHGTSWEYTGRIVGRVQRNLERALRPATDMLVAVCPEEAETFVRSIGFPAARVRVVPNGVRLPDVATLGVLRARTRAALGVAPDAVWAVFVGRLTAEKGLDVLLDALAERPGVDGLLVVGEGADAVALQSRAARAPVPVRFCGYQAEVGAYLAAADVFVAPSRSEGLPFAVLEAMAHRLPVVCTRVGGVPGAVGNAGRLVAPGAPGELATALRVLAADATLRERLADLGRARVARDFGVVPMVRALEAIYARAARAPHPAAVPAGEAA